MKTKNLISSLVCSLFLVSGQQAYANTYYSNQSNNYVTPDAPSKNKDTAKNDNKDKNKVVVTVKDENKDKVIVTAKVENKEKEKEKEVVKVDNKDKDKDIAKDDDEDGTNPLSFENLVTHNHTDNNHCKSKKSNECNEGDGEENHDDDKDDHEISPVPIPGAIWLFGTALVGFISMSSRRKV